MSHDKAHSLNGTDHTAFSSYTSGNLVKINSNGVLEDAGLSTSSILVVGQNYQYTTSMSLSSTTSSSYQDKLTLTTPTLTGTYRIFFTCVITDIDKQAGLRLYDATNAVELLTVQPRQKIDEICAAGTVILSFAAQARVLKLQWKDKAGGNQQDIGNAFLEIWRVS